MAIYHLAAQVISRGAGRNAVNAAAYRRGARMHDERTGETFSYVHKRDVLHSEITIPDDAPSWAKAILERHALEPVAASDAAYESGGPGILDGSMTRRAWGAIEPKERIATGRPRSCSGCPAASTHIPGKPPWAAHVAIVLKLVLLFASLFTIPLAR